jgi:uncharacterized Zn finger protein
VDALEQRARLDPNRLPRGRDYAHGGAVGELVLAPGEARARVQGRRVSPYDVRVRVRRFTDEEWAQVLDAISAQLGRVAAMLDGDLPPEVAGDVAAAAVRMLLGRTATPGKSGRTPAHLRQDRAAVLAKVAPGRLTRRS